MVSGVLDPILLPSAITVARTHPHLLMDILSSLEQDFHSDSNTKCVWFC